MSNRALFILAAALTVTGCRSSEQATSSAPAQPQMAQQMAQHETAAAPKPAEPAMVRVEGFAMPESVLYDAADDVYLVSNVNGAPAAKDGNGFISRVSPDGKVLALKWIEGSRKVKLDAPKGMGLSGNTLYVADITAVRMFDRKTGAFKGSIDVKHATFLNDIVVRGDGSVYVSDTGVSAGKGGALATNGSDAIYRITPKHKVEKVIAAKDLGGPNGLAFMGNDLVCVTLRSGEVFRVLPNGKREMMPKPPAGALDGVIARPDGSLLVSSWDGKAVYSLTGGKYAPVATDLASPADIGYDTKRNRLLVPLYMDNAIVILGMPSSV